MTRFDTIGDLEGTVGLTIGPRFLELFSQHLYSSPNKAFEELIANSWDAGARSVYIGIGDDLEADNAAIWVLDDGSSMDLEGLRKLWNVAVSLKRSEPQNGRPQIGRFGIGKLATYLLANEITYICRTADGTIRCVTVDYRKIDEASGVLDTEEKITLEVRKLTENDSREVISPFEQGREIISLLENEIPTPKTDQETWIDEYGNGCSEYSLSPKTGRSSWTLVLLTSLKDAGKRLQIGRFRWMLRAALPLGSDMVISLNNEVLKSSKLDVLLNKEWVLGKDTLELDSIELNDGSIIKVSEKLEPCPHVKIDGIEGFVTGIIRYYKGSISGGKSEAMGTSNGFHINILGRILNLEDPYFGLENLNHSLWAKIRVTIRMDGLDRYLQASREKIQEGEALLIVQAFLRAIFNKLRKLENEFTSAFPDEGDILTKPWGTVPLRPLKDVIRENIENLSRMPTFIDTSNVEEAEVKAHWSSINEENPRDVIDEIRFEDLGTHASLEQFRLADRVLVVNEGHPFFREHGKTIEERDLFSAMAFVNLLTDAYSASNGINRTILDEVRGWRDKAYRLTAQISRKSAPQIADMLVKVSSNSAKGFEKVVGEALEYIGFSVKPMGQSGEPEGVATAPLPAEDGKINRYSFTYDAKSSEHNKAKTANLNVAGLVRHRKNHRADYTLVVAPGFENGALQQECEQNNITPIRADDLALLLMSSGANGPFDLKRFRALFDIHDPSAVSEWVRNLIESHKNVERLSLGMLLKAMEDYGYEGPNPITANSIADKLKSYGLKEPLRHDVIMVASGLQILMPHLVSVSGYDIYLNASPSRVRSELRTQLENIPESLRFGLDKTVE